jgi:hypothetical protein
MGFFNSPLGVPLLIRGPVGTTGENLLRLESVDLRSLLSNPVEIMPTPSRLCPARDPLVGLRWLMPGSQRRNRMICSTALTRARMSSSVL